MYIKEGETREEQLYISLFPRAPMGPYECSMGYPGKITVTYLLIVKNAKKKRKRVEEKRRIAR